MNVHVSTAAHQLVDVSFDRSEPVSAEERRFITEIRGRVADLLAQWEADRDRDGQSTTDGDRREYAKVLIKRDLENRSKQLLAQGMATIDGGVRERLSREVLARLTGAGSLQTLLERRDWTDIHGHGTEVWIVHTDGHRGGLVACCNWWDVVTNRQTERARRYIAAVILRHVGYRVCALWQTWRPAKCSQSIRVPPVVAREIRQAATEGVHTCLLACEWVECYNHTADVVDP